MLSRLSSENSLIPRNRINTSWETRATYPRSTQDLPKEKEAIKLTQIAKFYSRKQPFILIKELLLFKNLNTALLGTNGAGKSTILDLLSSKKLLNFGSIEFKLKSNFRKINASRQIGYVFQANELWDSITLIELLEIFAKLRGLNFKQTYQQIFFLIMSMKLATQLHTYTQNLSQGNRRRLQIALSLISCPEFGILDEPTTGLDPFQKARFWSMISYINRVKQRMTLLTIQKQEQALLHCQHFLRMHSGRLVQGGQVKFSVIYVLEFPLQTPVPNELKELIIEIEECGEKVRLYFSDIDFMDLWEGINSLGERERKEVKIWYEFR